MKRLHRSTNGLRIYEGSLDRLQRPTPASLLSDQKDSSADLHAARPGPVTKDQGSGIFVLGSCVSIVC